MYYLFSLIKYNKFFLLYIMKYLSIITLKKQLIIIIRTQFILKILFQITKIFNYINNNRVDLVTDLIFKYKLFIYFYYFILVIVLIYAISIFCLAFLKYSFFRYINSKILLKTKFFYLSK